MIPKFWRYYISKQGRDLSYKNMEFVKIEDIKDEVLSIHTLSTIKESSGIESVEQMTLAYDIPIDEIVIEPIECEKSDTEETVTPHDIETSIETETNITKDEVDIKEHEFRYEQLKSIKIAHHKPGNEYLEPKAIKCYDLVDEPDFDPGQYVNDNEIVQNVEKEDTDSIKIHKKKHNKNQQCKRIRLEDECKTAYVGKFKLKRKDKDSLARHRTRKNNKSVASACTENDKRPLQTHIKVAQEGDIKSSKCQSYEYNTKSKSCLNKHSTRKNSENAKLYQCANCDYKAKVKKYLFRHWRASHTEKIKWHHYNSCDFETKYKYSSQDTSQKKT